MAQARTGALERRADCAHGRFSVKDEATVAHRSGPELDHLPFGRVRTLDAWRALDAVIGEETARMTPLTRRPVIAVEAAVVT